MPGPYFELKEFAAKEKLDIIALHDRKSRLFSAHRNR